MSEISEIGSNKFQLHNPALRRKVYSFSDVRVAGFTRREHRLEALTARTQQLKLLGNRAIFGDLLNEKQILALANPDNARLLNQQSDDFFDNRHSTVFAERFTPLEPVGTVIDLVGFADGVGLGKEWEKYGLSVYVAEEYRRRGIGGLMVRKLLEQATHDAEVVATAPRTAELANQFYTGVGLKAIGEAVRTVKGSKIDFVDYGGVSIEELKQSLDRRYYWLGSGIKDSNPVQSQSEKTP